MIYISSQKKVVERIVIKICLNYSNWQEVSRSTLFSLIRLSFSFCLAGKSTAFTPGSEIRLLLCTKSQKKNILQWCLFGFHRPMKKNKWFFVVIALLRRISRKRIACDITTLPSQTFQTMCLKVCSILICVSALEGIRHYAKWRRRDEGGLSMGEGSGHICSLSGKFDHWKTLLYSVP